MYINIFLDTILTDAVIAKGSDERGKAASQSGGRLGRCISR